MTLLAKRFVDGGSAAGAVNGQHDDEAAIAHLNAPLQQLEYLARCVGFGLQVTDFPQVRVWYTRSCLCTFAATIPH
jgi:hypothetical protein